MIMDKELLIKQLNKWIEESTKDQFGFASAAAYFRVKQFIEENDNPELLKCQN